MLHSRLWYSVSLVALSWLGFELLKSGGIGLANPAHLIEVRTVPPGAEILLDGQAAGMSDSFLPVPDGNGPHRVAVRVKKNGYEDASGTIEAESSKCPLIVFELKPKAGRLDIHGEERANVKLRLGPDAPPNWDGEPLTPGLYEVWGIHEGLVSNRAVIILKPGETQEVHLSWGNVTAPVNAH